MTASTRNRALAPKLIAINSSADRMRPMVESPFAHHREAALALLSQCPDLTHKAAGFLGHVCVAPILSDRQRDWLVKLLHRNGLPSFACDGAGLIETKKCAF